MTEDEILAMEPGRELDALVAEKVMGICLIPPREYAMVKVGWNYIAMTGKTFTLTTGERLTVPPGEELKQPEGTNGWNDRYAFYVAEFLGERIKDEVDSYRLRLEFKTYSTDIKAAWEVIEKVVADVYHNAFYIRKLPTKGYAVGMGYGKAMAMGNTAPEAICKAALLTVMEREGGKGFGSSGR